MTRFVVMFSMLTLSFAFAGCGGAADTSAMKADAPGTGKDISDAIGSDISEEDYAKEMAKQQQSK